LQIAVVAGGGERGERHAAGNVGEAGEVIEARPVAVGREADGVIELAGTGRDEHVKISTEFGRRHSGDGRTGHAGRLTNIVEAIPVTIRRKANRVVDAATGQ